jgi:hypothetical protein
MASCIARWEWRTFGESVPDVESRLRSVLAPPRTSSELYLVVPHADLNLKVRDGVLELKELVDVSAEGLERWMPTIKAARCRRRRAALGAAADLDAPRGDPR